MSNVTPERIAYLNACPEEATTDEIRAIQGEITPEEAQQYLEGSGRLSEDPLEPELIAGLCQRGTRFDDAVGLVLVDRLV